MTLKEMRDTLYCSLCTALCVLLSVYCSLCTALCVLLSVYCSLCTAHCVLLTFGLTNNSYQNNHCRKLIIEITRTVNQITKHTPCPARIIISLELSPLILAKSGFSCFLPLLRLYTATI